MKSTIFSIAAAAVAAVVTAVAPQASAAYGVVIINGVPFESWNGYLDHCLNHAITWVENRTDVDVAVYSDVDCTGKLEVVVRPGERFPIAAISLRTLG